MTSSSPRKPRITALIRNRSERLLARPLVAAGLCVCVAAAAAALLTPADTVDAPVTSTVVVAAPVPDVISGAVSEAPVEAVIAEALPVALPPDTIPVQPSPPAESELVVFPERAIPIELPGDGILLVSGASSPVTDEPQAEIVLAAGIEADAADAGIILVSAGAADSEAVAEPAIALADEPAAESPTRDRAPAGSRLRPRDSGAERRAAARREPCAESSKACRDALQFLRDDDIASIDLDIRVSGTPGNDYPCECRLEGETFQPRRFASTTMTWKAAGYCHKPLYFEDWELERYGHSRGMFIDPFIAGAHFFVTLPILPYKAGMQAPWECVYPLGYYRPGSCAPWTVPGVPYSPRGFAVQAATVTGLVFLLP